MFYTVYKITNNINGKIYVGAHQTNDLNDEYMGSGMLVKTAIKKHGIDNFSKEYLGVYTNKNDMFEMEAIIVNNDFVHNSKTYNMKEGGLGGDTSAHVPYNEESYKKSISDGMIKFFKDNPDRRKEFAKRLSLHRVSFEGKHHTDESKQKISKANSKHQQGTGNSQYGTCWIHSLPLKSNKKIKKVELNSYLSKGWIKGRKMKF